MNLFTLPKVPPEEISLRAVDQTTVKIILKHKCKKVPKQNK